jgi:hypothetical protein
MGAEVWAQALIDFCRGRIANDKVPREVHFNDPGPWLMSLTRINKRQLRVRRAGPSSDRTCGRARPAGRSAGA